jgi:tetratricopeptide (TPR) repeat protein
VVVLFSEVSAKTHTKKPVVNPAASQELTLSTAHKDAAKEVETYSDLIAKAQNLTLQRDRLQASQVLLRAIQREPKNTPAYRELTKALDELTSVFYTERAQSTFVAGESALPLKPKEAIESFNESLRLEDANVAVLKALARTHLLLDECDKAEGFIKTAESLNPLSSETALLRLQVYACSKNANLLAAKLMTIASDLGSYEKFARGIQVRELIAKPDVTGAKALIGKWESETNDYPEIQYWKWELSRLAKSPDRGAAVRYIQLCQNLTPRKRKSYSFDVELCKGKPTVDEFLKATNTQGASPEERSDD